MMQVIWDPHQKLNGVGLEGGAPVSRVHRAESETREILMEERSDFEKFLLHPHTNMVTGIP